MKCIIGAGGGAYSVSRMNLRKINVFFEQYFTNHEFKRENFKSQLNLRFCEIHASRINFRLNHL